MDEEKKADFENRKTQWLEKYKALMDEYKIDIFCQPQYIPDGQGAFKTIIRQDLVDIKDQLVPSDPNNFL